jgi:alanine-glyoxylate transaminase / serine-glyoxylate transaminase / serine-pyruvate transaminase
MTTTHTTTTNVGLPAAERILLGPGPSPVSPRVMRAMVAPVLSHLDPDMLAMLDDVRARLGRLFLASADAFSLAISGTGTAGMEAAVANLVREGSHVLVVISGYFGERMADMCLRYGALVNRVDVPWGRAADPDSVRRALRAGGADIVAMVHAETSTGVLNPVEAIAEVAREFGCLTLVDAVTSLAAHPVDVERWQLDVVYSCTQKGALGARASHLLHARAIAVPVARAQLLLRSRPARAVLDRPQVSPHNCGAARLCAARGAPRDRGGGTRGALGASSPASSRAGRGTRRDGTRAAAAGR